MGTESVCSFHKDLHCGGIGGGGGITVDGGLLSETWGQ